MTHEEQFLNHYLEKSNRLKSSFVQDGFDDYIDVLSIMESKAAAERRVLMGELLPLLLSELSGLPQESEEKVIHAWYILYAATIFLDDLVDGDVPATPEHIVEASCLVNLAHMRLNEIVGGSPLYREVLEDLQCALVGELQDVMWRSIDRSLGLHLDQKKNSVLVALGRIIQAHSSSTVNLVDFCQALIPCIQALDDLGDLSRDLRGGNFTSIAD